MRPDKGAEHLFRGGSPPRWMVEVSAARGRWRSGRERGAKLGWEARGGGWVWANSAQGDEMERMRLWSEATLIRLRKAWLGTPPGFPPWAPLFCLFFFDVSCAWESWV